MGFWEGNSNTLNAITLLGSGTVADLLRLTENPKNSAGKQQQAPSRGQNRTSTTFRIAYTVFIRRVGVIYSDEEPESSIGTPSIPVVKKELGEKKSRAQRSRKTHSKVRPISDFSSDNSDPEPEVIFQNISEGSASTSLTREISAPTILPSAPSPTTPPPSNPLSSSLISRKRSLTLLSPKKVSTRTTRESKKVAFQDVTELDSGGTGSSTEIDNDSGFQFLTDMD